MAHKTVTSEYRNMQLADLEKEITDQRGEVAKLYIAVKMQKEKNSAKYKQQKKKLAQMETVLTEKRKEQLLSKGKNSTVSAQKSSSKS